ncbi:MAG TPA: sodium/proton-translocating pyrophosphatase, partial [Candidatus Limnocylindrales bacterium]|nr:sodium/proton-translocating pyrophosphatase [Candidatus Limnocylindrales bacterium]
IMDGSEQPDPARAVDISTAGALREMVLPGAIAVIVPVAVGALIGPAALGGVLVGSISSGALLALMMANAGGAWDNAKKYIETGHFGGKGSEAHKAAVVGDTIGDPFKDTAGPSLNILLKLMAIVAVVFGPLFL